MPWAQQARSPSSMFASPPQLPLIAPSILSADFGCLAADCQAVFDGGADLLHVDVMDGHFVPNLSMGPAVCASLARHFPEAYLDVHLMVQDARAYVESFAKAGASHMSVHVEVTDEPVELANELRAMGVSPGIALNPETPVELVYPIIEAFDLVLLMSVHPGFSGQAFLPEALGKAQAIRTRFGDSVRIQADGGVNPTTAHSCRDAGFDVLVSGSTIFGSNDYAAEIAMLRGC